METTASRPPRRPTRAENDALSRCLAETVSRCIPTSTALAALTWYAMERRYLPRTRLRTPTLLLSALTGYAVAGFTVQRRCQDRLCRVSHRQPITEDSLLWRPPVSRDLYRAYPTKESPGQEFEATSTELQYPDEYISNPDLDYALPFIPASQLPVGNNGSRERWRVRKQPDTTYEELRTQHRSHKVIVPVSQRRRMKRGGNDPADFIAGQPN